MEERPVNLPLLPTTLVGSYPQPDWLIDREALGGRLPPRVRASDLWRVDERRLKEAQDDATIVAIRDQERAGLDIVTDGEIRRESYSNRFALALDGIDADNPGSMPDRLGNPMPVPRITGPIRRREQVQVEDLRFLRENTDRAVKITVPGPFTMSQQAQDEHYASDEERAYAFADAVREEIADLFAAGADVVQLDEPWMEARAEQARRFGIETLRRALDGITGTTALHICFGYPSFMGKGRAAEYHFLPELAASPVDQISIETAQTHLDLAVLERLEGKTIILGVVALDSADVESAETVAERIRRALPHKSPQELVIAPDCGMKYLPRDAAFAKLESLVAGARAVRAEVAAGVGRT
jgi:5-methyltetrahydropteroyltriglutamate--homocysteine methyltransferase